MHAIGLKESGIKVFMIVFQMYLFTLHYIIRFHVHKM